MVDPGESPRRDKAARAPVLRVLAANAFAAAGLALLIRGLWMLSPAVAIIALGLAMLTAGIIARVRC